MTRMGPGLKKDVSEEAACWQARLAAPDCTGFERARFEEWRTRSPENARASDAVERVDSLLEGLAGSDAELLAMADEAYAVDVAQPAPQRTRRWAVPATLAASVVITALLIGVASDQVSPETGSIAHLMAPDGRREFTLTDGSVVHLDVGGEVSARMAGDQRNIELVRGRALFEVAHDKSRPFTVVAGSARVRALGTQFQVQREPGRVTVTLTEGSVAVSDTALPSWTEKLRPGEEISVSSESGSRVKHETDVQVSTSWSRGRHVFRGTPLERAVQEVNYYAARKVRLGDPQLASLTVGGNFVAGDSESVVAAFAAALPVRVVDAGGELILFRRYEAESH